MKLSESERESLEFTKSLRGKSMFSGELRRDGWKSFLAFFSFWALIILFPSYTNGFTLLGAFLLGGVLGIIVCALTYLWLSSRGWPVAQEIIDWEKLDRVLMENREP